MTQPSKKLVGDLFLALTRHLDTPVSLGAWLRFKYGEFHQLVSMPIDPKDYIDPNCFRKDYLAIEYLSKYQGFDLGIDPTAVAFDAFNKAEELCRSTNHRLRHARSGSIPKHVSPIISLAIRKISDLLGDLNYDWLNQCKWGPGATATITSQNATLANKLLEKQLSITSRALPFARAAIGIDIQWLRARGINAVGPTSLLDSEFQIVESSRFTTVPKSAKTERCIACEPTLNQFLQGGLGLMLRRKLKSIGIDLRSQRANQRAASVAYEKSLATVDLSAASDTISKELIWMLLPIPWADTFDKLRTHSISVNSKFLGTSAEPSTIDIEKFSSMGNGFTFELETMIFWSIAQSVCDYLGIQHRVAVYGDDIIIPTSGVRLLKEAFTFLGFTMNQKKTHYDSCFRESCGVHYFGSVDVTPIYLKKIIDSDDRIIRAHNQFVRLSQRWYDYCGIMDKTFLAAISRLRAISMRRKYLMPLYATGDDAFLACQSEVGAIHANGSRLLVLSAVASRFRTTEEPYFSYWIRFIGEHERDCSPSLVNQLVASQQFRPPFLASVIKDISVISDGQPLLSKHGKVSKRNETKYLPRKRKFHTWEGGEILWA